MSNEIGRIEQYRQRLFHILEVGPEEDRIGRAYDILNLATIILNLIVSILYTFEEYRIPYGDLLLRIEAGQAKMSLILRRIPRPEVTTTTESPFWK